MRRFGASVLARKHGQPVPEDGYPGQFVAELAARYDGPDDAAEAGRWGGEQVLADIKTTLESINIHYDEWYSQASIEESGAVAETIEVLRGKGLIFDREGATWLRTEDFGDPRKERVVIKSNGDVTYLGGDIAYHRNKFVIRGYDRVIDVWGADHQAQVPSLLAAVEALGVPRGQLEVKIGQMVSLASGRMSKRLGNTVDLSELIEDIGPDATRLLTLLSSVDSATTIDLDVIREQSRENPVYYVQYAHARIASINRVAAERGVDRLPLADVDVALLVHERELDLLRTLFELPDVMQAALEERAPHKITDMGARARRPVPRLLPRLLRDGGGRQPGAHSSSTVARRGGADRPRDRPRRARRACPRLDVTAIRATSCLTLPPSTRMVACRSAASTSSTSRPSTALLCSSTTKSICGLAAVRPSRRSDRTSRSTRRRRSCAERWRGSSTRKGCVSMSRPAGSSTSPWLPAFRPSASCSTATTRARTSCAWPERRPSGARSSTRSTSSTVSTRCIRRMGSRRRCCCGSRPGSRRTPTST